MHKFTIAAASALCFAGAAYAGCELDTDDFEDLIGYEITGVKTVAGWADAKAGETGEASNWEGCRYDRKIILDDGTMLICESYEYGSAYGEQDAVIFERFSDVKVCIDDELYDVKGW